MNEKNVYYFMYITYVTFVINSNERKMKREPMLNLRRVFEKFASDVKTMKNGSLTIDNLEVCSNNRGCTPKKGLKDYLTAYIDEKKKVHRSKKAENESKYVVMFLNGTYRIGNVECAVNIRLPPSGVVKVSIGLSTQKEIIIDKRGEEGLQKLKRDLQKDILGCIPELELVRPTKLVSMNMEGYNIITQSEEKANRRMINLVLVIERLKDQMKGYKYDYQNREGKTLPRLFLKPEIVGENPTIGITTWGMLGLSGATSIKQIKETIETVQKAFNVIKNEIKYDEGNFLKPKSVKKKEENVKTCPRGNPAPNEKGECEQGFIPRPNAKTKSLCCYKQKLTKAMIQTIVNQYSEAKIQIPPKLKNEIEQMGKIKSSSVKYANVPEYNKTKKKWRFKNKTFNCKLLDAERVKSIAKSLGMNPNAKKYQLCKKIEEALDKQLLDKRLAAVKKFKILKAKAMNAKYSN